MVHDNNNWFESLLISPRLRALRHFLLQILILLLSMNALGNENEVFVIATEQLWGWVVFYILLNVLCYLNIYLLVPRLLLTGRIGSYVWYIVCSMFVFVLFSFLAQFAYEHSAIRVESISGLAIQTAASSLSIGLVLSATSTIALLIQWQSEQKRVGEIKLSTKLLELNMLKQQINPHFLFNMLNNANVLLNRDPKEASQVLFNLEELLNYQLNDSTKELVSLDSDIHFLNDFLKLEQIRRDRFTYSIVKEGDVHGIKVPPLLFIPFVENAIKHNPDSINASYIKIEFKIKGSELYFRCENSKPALPLAKSHVGGLGLKNIRRRLELLYPGQYTLSISDEDTQFTVILIIKHIFQ